jgi:hypothetical protein
MQHHETIRTPRSNYTSYHCDITLGVGILDAPMVGVRVSESGNRLSYMPWVRVAKHESSGSNVQDRTYRPDRLLAVDIVHKDYFRTYLHQHLYPFAQAVSGRIANHEQALASGEGYVYDDWTLKM